MKVAFRVDASLQIGSGHVMRCLTLAGQLRFRGAEILFICRELPGNLNDLISAKGFELCRLPMPTGQSMNLDWNRHASWLEVSWQQDADETRDCIQGKLGGCNWLIADHYALERCWHEKLRFVAEKIMVIDDLADRAYDCDVLLDQNLYGNEDVRYPKLVIPSCAVLTGPKYALLRPEFAEVRKQLRSRNGEVRRLLVFYGGSDVSNETTKALDAIRRAQLKDVEVDVVVGSGNPNRNQIESLCATLPNVCFHCQVENMADLMSSADIMLCGGGTTTWERCSLGLPGLVVAISENQEEVADNCARQGLSIYLGRASAVSAEKLAETLKVLCSSPQLLQMFSLQELATVDAMGAQRVAGVLTPPVIMLRRATSEDCDLIFEWRNAEETRRFIFDQEPIPLEVHRRWYRKTMENPGRVLLVGEVGSKPVGVLRYDIEGDEALISVYLVPGGQGVGIGPLLICAGSAWVQENLPDVRVINAEILRMNIPSLRAFAKAGYEEHHVTYKKVLQ